MTSGEVIRKFTMFNMFKKLDRNSKATIFTDPFRMVTMLIAGYFVIPYILDNGLTEMDYGNAQSIATAIGFGISFFAAAVTNKLGRKLATILFQDIPYVIALVALLFKGSYVGLLTYMICGLSIVKIGQTSYMLLMTEDASEENRPFILGYTIAIPLAAGLLYPIVGVFIKKYNITTTMQFLLIGIIIIMILNIFARIKLYKETENGKAIMSSPQNDNIGKSIISYIKNVPTIVFNFKYLILGIMYFLNMATMYMGMVFPSYILGKALMTDVQYSNLAIGTAILSLIGNFVIIPWFGKRQIRETRIYIIFSLVSAIFLFCFTLAQEGAFTFIFVINALYGLAGFFTMSHADAIIINNVPQDKLSDIYGTIQVLVSLLLIPIPAVYGKLLSQNLDKAIYACVAIWIVNAISTVIFSMLNRNKVKTVM